MNHGRGTKAKYIRNCMKLLFTTAILDECALKRCPFWLLWCSKNYLPLIYIYIYVIMFPKRSCVWIGYDELHTCNYTLNIHHVKSKHDGRFEWHLLVLPYTDWGFYYRQKCMPTVGLFRKKRIWPQDCLMYYAILPRILPRGWSSHSHK